MAQKVEVPSGAIDGINDAFTTSVPYRPGSLAVWINGQEILGCYTEDDPSAGTFTILAPSIPRTGAWGTDTLAVDFDDPSVGADIVEVDRIACVISEPDPILAVVQDFETIACLVQDSPDQVVATVADLDVVAAIVEDGDRILASVKDC
jgi:hypothetical protein